MSNTKLNQLIAIENGVKAKAKNEVTDIHRQTTKVALLSGISRVYSPKDEDGDQLPSESTLVQVKIPDALNEVATALTRLFDVTLTKESANATAKADVVVLGKVLIKDAPVTYLLFLEKQLVDVYTFVNKLPTLDPTSEWHWDENLGVFKTAETKTVRSKKVLKNHVKAEATDKHPAQVEMFHEDILVGHWSKTDFSGAIPATRKRELVDRVEELQKAVKFAREDANSTTVTDREIGKDVFDYLFA